MKTNWKLLTCIITLVVVITTCAGLAFGLTADKRMIGELLDNMQSSQFDYVDLVVEQDNLVVYSSIKGKITNIMGLEIDNNMDISKLNWNKRNLKGDVQKTDNAYFYNSIVKDSKSFCGEYIQDMAVKVQVNRTNKKIEKVVITYADRGFDITITAYKDAL